MDVCWRLVVACWRFAIPRGGTTTLLFFSAPVAVCAHADRWAFSDFHFEDRSVRLELRATIQDLAEGVRLDRDGDGMLTPAEMKSGEAAVRQFVADGVRLSNRGRLLVPRLEGIDPPEWPEPWPVLSLDRIWIVVRTAWDDPLPMDDVRITSTLFAGILHFMNKSVMHHGYDEVQWLWREDYAWKQGGPLPTQAPVEAESETRRIGEPGRQVSPVPPVPGSPARGEQRRTASAAGPPAKPPPADRAPERDAGGAFADGLVHAIEGTDHWALLAAVVLGAATLGGAARTAGGIALAGLAGAWLAGTGSFRFGRPSLPGELFALGVIFAGLEGLAAGDRDGIRWAALLAALGHGLGDAAGGAAAGLSVAAGLGTVVLSGALLLHPPVIALLRRLPPRAARAVRVLGGLAVVATGIAALVPAS